MHHMKLVLNIRLVALLVVTAAVLLAASSLTAPPRQASAVTGFDLADVFCIDIHFDTAPLIANPATHTGGPDGSDVRAAEIMVRFDEILPGLSWFVTSQALQTGEFPPTTDLTSASCVGKGDNNPEPPPEDSAGTPTFAEVPVAKFDKVAGTVVWTSPCDFIPAFNLFILTEFTIFVDGNSANDNFGRNRARLGSDATICDDVGGSLLFSPMVVVNRVATKGLPIGGVDDDWDGDGKSDWNELDPNLGGNSVFRPPSSVGGVAELAEAAGAPLAAPDSSGSNTGLIAGIVAAIAAGVVSLGGAAWYARRRTIQ